MFKDKVTTKEGATVKSETVVVLMSADLLRESLAILRSYAKVVMNGVDKRFMNSGVTDDAVHVFALEYIPKSAAHVEPRAALNRLAIFSALTIRHCTAAGKICKRLRRKSSSSVWRIMF